jgi:UDP-N-acetylglucosamine 2-epimerase (hydrolysing)
MYKKKILFVTGTRADFGKIKSIIKKFKTYFDVRVIVTGMHLQKKYGYTYNEVKDFCKEVKIYKFKNFTKNNRLDKILANTINKFTKILFKINPDLVIVHGDRVEAFACAISSTFNNFLSAHIEGGELSGNIDEHIRHSISKLCHIHFVSNNDAKQRLLSMGENKNSVFVVGSPDYDLMKEKFLPSISQLKKRYKIEFNNFAISIIHPPTKYKKNKINIKTYFDSLLASKVNFIIIYPNNDPGNEFIIKEIKRIVKTENRFKVFPSMRFEYFLRALKISNFIIGNSSAGIREAPFFSIPTINVGDRQFNRANLKSISNVNFNKKQIINKIKNISVIKKRNFYFGKGDSADNIYKIIRNKNFWNTSIQKRFFTY